MEPREGGFGRARWGEGGSRLVAERWRAYGGRCGAGGVKHYPVSLSPSPHRPRPLALTAQPSS